MFDYNMRLVLLGECAVGKTAFASKLTKGYYQNRHDTTIGVEYSAKIIPINNESTIKCQLWDTSGQKRFTPLIKTYYNNVAGVILIYDVNRRSTYEKLYFWMNELEKYIYTDYPISKIIIGNKIDLGNRTVSKDEASQLAKDYGFMYREMSVKEDVNVEESLVALSEDIYKNKEVNDGIKKSKLEYFESNKTKNRANCCCLC